MCGPVAGFPTFFWAPQLRELGPSASLWVRYGSQGTGEGTEMMWFQGLTNQQRLRSDLSKASAISDHSCLPPRGQQNTAHLVQYI